MPFVHAVGLGGAALCVFVMKGLPRQAWERFGWWLLIGLVMYFFYGYSHSGCARPLRRTGRPPPAELIPLSGLCRNGKIQGLGRSPVPLTLTPWATTGLPSAARASTT